VAQDPLLPEGVETLHMRVPAGLSRRGEDQMDSQERMTWEKAYG
jgi:hypothetical protein